MNTIAPSVFGDWVDFATTACSSSNGLRNGLTASDAGATSGTALDGRADHDSPGSAIWGFGAGTTGSGGATGTGGSSTAGDGSTGSTGSGGSSVGNGGAGGGADLDGGHQD
jgi:hypothetical protein